MLCIGDGDLKFGEMVKWNGTHFRCHWVIPELACRYTVWVKKKIPPPLRGPDISHFSHKRLRIFNGFFTHLLNVPIFARLQIFFQLSPILTKLCHIKRDYPVQIICATCPKRAKTRAFRRLRKSLQLCWSLSVASHYKINTFIMSTNMLDMTWRQQWRHLLSKQT